MRDLICAAPNGPIVAKALTSVLSKAIDRTEIEASDPSIKTIPSEMTLESKHA